MVNSRDLKNKIRSLLVEGDSFFTPGNGIIDNEVFRFDRDKLEENKKAIANILLEVGADMFPMITLETLTTTLDDQIWNELETLEDFEALDLLLACSDACGFIINNSFTKQSNTTHLGGYAVILTEEGKKTININEWLKLMRDIALRKMYYLTDQELINKALSDNIDKPIQKQKDDN